MKAISILPKRIGVLGFSPHAWCTFLSLNFVLSKLGIVKKGNGTHAPIINYPYAIAEIEMGGELSVGRSFAASKRVA